MSYKEVQELKKLKKLDEAYRVAMNDFALDPENIWNKRSLGWVLYEYLKVNANIENYDKFLDLLIQINQLELPVEENLIFEKCAFQIGKIIFSYSKDEKFDNSKINMILEKIQLFHFPKPSESYSFICKAFYKCSKSWPNFIHFCDWWGFENFSPQDYLKEEFNDRKQISLVEKMYIAYSKKLLEGELKQSDGGQVFTKIDKIKIEKFIPKLNSIIKEHPEFQYPPYYQAKLLIAMGDEQNILSSFLPFAKQKRNDFWVWDLLSDMFQQQDERKIACLCKALSLKNPEDFVIKTRQKLAEVLIDEQKYQEAKTEIVKIVNIRSENQWKIPKQIIDWMESSWYKSTIPLNDNKLLYQSYIKLADEILFEDIPEETVVVEFVNESKSILNFVKDNNKHGFFKYSEIIENPKIGDILNVRFISNDQNGFYKLASIKKMSDNTKCEALKEFEGLIKIKENCVFGFVDDVFLDQTIIKKYDLKKDDPSRGKAILSYNKKRNEWGWKAITIEVY